jgi:hypothetical protein
MIIDSNKDTETLNQESLARQKATRNTKELAEAFDLGGQTLSEALRSPKALSSTKERRQIKEAYRRAKDSANLTGENDSFKSSGIGNSNRIGLESSGGGGSQTFSGFVEEDFTVVINGSTATRTFLTKSS